MKKLIASSMAVLLATPALAGGHYEQQTSNLLGWDVLPYVALRGGATYGNLNYSLENDKKSITQNMYQLRAALGLTMYETARFELEGSFFTKGNKQEAFGGLDNTSIANKNVELMANAYMNIGHFKYIQPFAGIGAGLAFIDVQADANSDSSTKFSGMGTLGLSMPFGCFSVDVAARYNYIDVASGMHNFSGDLGVVYKF